MQIDVEPLMSGGGGRGSVINPANHLLSWNAYTQKPEDEQARAGDLTSRVWTAWSCIRSFACSTKQQLCLILTRWNTIDRPVKLPRQEKKTENWQTNCFRQTEKKKPQRNSRKSAASWNVLLFYTIFQFINIRICVRFNDWVKRTHDFYLKMEKYFHQRLCCHSMNRTRIQPM